MNMRFGSYIRSLQTRLGYSLGLNIWILLVIYQVSSCTAVNPPSSLSVSNVTATTAVLTWKPGDVTDDYYINIDCLKYSRVLVSHTEQIQIDLLRPQVWYNVTVFTNTPTSGEVATSDMLKFRTTLENTWPLNASATMLSRSEVKVEWNKPLTNMTILGYNVYYAPHSELGQPIHTFSSERYIGSTQTAAILNLPDTYFFIVSAYSADGEGPITEEVFAEPWQDPPRVVPGSPRGIRVTSTNSTSILVKWKPPKDRPKIIEGYYVFYREVIEDGEPLSRPPRVESNDTEIVINGLKEGTTYEITVTVWDGIGEGIYSRPKQVTTEKAFSKYQKEELKLIQRSADSNERIAALLLRTYEAVAEIATLLNQNLR